MGIWWRRDADQGMDSVAAARWQETARIVARACLGDGSRKVG